jgi:hypothetical protein
MQGQLAHRTGAIPRSPPPGQQPDNHVRLLLKMPLVRGLGSLEKLDAQHLVEGLRHGCRITYQQKRDGHQE